MYALTKRGATSIISKNVEVISENLDIENILVWDLNKVKTIRKVLYIFDFKVPYVMREWRITNKHTKDAYTTSQDPPNDLESWPTSLHFYSDMLEMSLIGDNIASSIL